ncbi:MAG: right-handed parallel beta-helix repeat-containing protein [Myxococcota bacterium]
MTRHASTLATVTLFGPLLAASVAPAATICVSAQGGSCQTTIQAAVDAAQAGDVIRLKPGLYFENVTIPSGKDGLEISGPRTAILDAGDDRDGATPENMGPALSVASNGVAIRSITIRNGEGAGVLLADGVTGTRVDRVRFSHNGDYGVLSAGVGNDDTTVLRNAFIGLDNTGATDLLGDRITFASNVVLGGDRPVTIEGDDLVFERNRVELNGNDGDCIDLRGDRVEVVSNHILGCGGGWGLDLVGNDALVTRNRVEYVQDGIGVFGTQPTVTDNRLLSIEDGPGIEVNCNTGCGTARVAGNRLVMGMDDAEGLVLRAGAPGLLVERNLVDRFTDHAIELLTTGATARNNRVVDSSATEFDSCIRVQSGVGNTLERNRLDGCSDGIEVNSADNVVRDNTAVWGSKDGIDLTGNADGTTVTGNRAYFNSGVGFELTEGVTGVVMERNRARGNHTDLCDDSSGTTTFVDNDFETTYVNVTDGAVNDCPVGF